jgi:integrase
MGYLKSLGNKRFRIVYDLPLENGKRRQKTETLENTNKKAANAVLADRESNVSKGLYVGDESTTFGDFFQTFMLKKRQAQKPRAASTLQGYASMFSTYLGPSFGSTRVSKISSQQIEAALQSWRGVRATQNGPWRKRALAGARTHRHAFDLLRHVLNVAIRSKIITQNVTLFVDQDEIPAPQKPEMTVLSADEVGRLLEEAKSPTNRSKSKGYVSAYAAYYPALAFLVYTGARRGEALALRWDDLDLTGASVTIRRSLSDTKGSLAFKEPKNGKARSVSIAPELVAILTEHREAQAIERSAMGTAYQDDGLVFSRADGSPIRPWNFGASFPGLVKRAGVSKVRLHDLRHTHASLMAMAGQPLDVISKRLGHSNIAITAERYLSVYTSRDEAASEAFATLLRP